MTENQMSLLGLQKSIRKSNIKKLPISAQRPFPEDNRANSWWVWSDASETSYTMETEQIPNWDNDFLNCYTNDSETFWVAAQRQSQCWQTSQWEGTFRDGLSVAGLPVKEQQSCAPLETAWIGFAECVVMFKGKRSVRMHRKSLRKHQKL